MARFDILVKSNETRIKNILFISLGSIASRSIRKSQTVVR